MSGLKEGDRPPTLLKPEYIAGLFDTSGRFTVSVNESSHSEVGYYLHPVARLTIKDKNHIKQHIEQFLDAYNVKYNVQKNEYHWLIAIQQPESIQKFGDAIGPFLLEQRRDGALLINEVIPAFQEDLNSSKQRFYEIMSIADKLVDGKNRKYTQQYFKELWEDELNLEVDDGN